MDLMRVYGIGEDFTLKTFFKTQFEELKKSENNPNALEMCLKAECSTTVH